MLERKLRRRLRLMSRRDSLDSDEYRSRVADKYPNLLEGPSVMKASFCIALKEDAKPFQVPVPRKFPLPLYQKAKEELDRMLEAGVISRVKGPINWCPWW